MTWVLVGLALAITAVMLLKMQQAVDDFRCIMYLTGQHPVTPGLDQLQHVTHVVLAFMGTSMFHDPARSKWPIFDGSKTVSQLRTQFQPGTKVMVAIGGWGDTIGFSTAARTANSRRAFAVNVARMIEATGADGVDIDWEFPGGNGEDYKIVPNQDKEWEISAFPLLLAELQRTLGPRKIISAAVPGRPEDMLAFDRQTIPRIMRHVDFLNVMTYDLAGRRDNVTKHHTGVQNSLDAINAYLAAGATPLQLNLGFAFYVKWFLTKDQACPNASSALGCPTLLGEDPRTGADLGRVGMFSWHDQVPRELEESFTKALNQGIYDDKEGGHYYWDEVTKLFWTFDTVAAISRKFPLIVDQAQVGGVFAWGLGEDAPTYEHFRVVMKGVAARKRVAQEGSLGKDLR